MKNYKKIMVFGVFDRLHDGHRFFLSEAQKLGEALVIAVARDSVVLRLKDHAPSKNEAERILELSTAFREATVVLGDRNDHAWEVIESHQPDCIALGYDQKKLETALEKARPNWPFLKAIVTITDHDGERLHSSML